MVQDIKAVQVNIEFGLLLIKNSRIDGANASLYQQLRLKQKTLFDRVDTYFAEKLTPVRFSQQVFSKLPVTHNQFNALKAGVVAKVEEANGNADVWPAGSQALATILHDAHHLGFDNMVATSESMNIQIDQYMEGLATHIQQNNLINDQDAMVKYERIANALYRTKDNQKSAKCFVYYMAKRRTVLKNAWYTNILTSQDGIAGQG